MVKWPLPNRVLHLYRI